MIPGKVRCGFFQEIVLHLQLAGFPFELAQPRPLTQGQRRLLARMITAVSGHPVTEGTFVDSKLLSHAGDRTRSLDHHLHGLILVFRREALLRSSQLLNLSRLPTLLDGLSGSLGAPQSGPPGVARRRCGGAPEEASWRQAAEGRADYVGDAANGYRKTSCRMNATRLAGVIASSTTRKPYRRGRRIGPEGVSWLVVPEAAAWHARPGPARSVLDRETAKRLDQRSSCILEGKHGRAVIAAAQPGGRRPAAVPDLLRMLAKQADKCLPVGLRDS